MSKVKVNLTSGSVVEKPLVTCFKGTNGNYLVLDNETNGSMGLPIICISKFNGTSAEKIFDQNEWASVKENLKTIIAGTALPYITVPETITAADDFFTQLTLPVASFDLLKDVYKPAETPAPVISAPAIEQTSVAQTPVTPAAVQPSSMAPSQVIAPAPISAPVNITPALEATPAQTVANVETPTIEAPIIAAPVVPSPVETVPAAPVVPTVDPVIAAPVIESPVIENPTTPVAPSVPVAPVEPVAPSPVETSTVSNEDIIALKENFMKSCENMFDALIKKFENK